MAVTVAICGRHVLQADVHLALDHLDQLAGFALFERLADAHDGGEARGDHGTCALVDGFVRLAKVLAALAVADDHVLRTGVDQHAGGDFARERALGFPVGILGADADVRSGGGRDCGGNVDRGRAAHDLDVREDLGRFGDFLHECSRLGRLDVHLPVSSDDFLSHFVFCSLLNSYFLCFTPAALNMFLTVSRKA